MFTFFIIFRLNNFMVQYRSIFWKGGALSNEFKLTQCSLRVFNLQLSDGYVAAGYLSIFSFKGKLHSFVCLNSCAETSTFIAKRWKRESIFKSHFENKKYFLNLNQILTYFCVIKLSCLEH